MRKSYLKTIAEHIHNILCISDDDALLFSTWLRMALDIIETKIYNPPPEKTKKELPKYRIKIPFVNKAMDFINLVKGLVTSFLTYFYFLTNQKDLKNEIQRYQNHSVKILRSDFTS